MSVGANSIKRAAKTAAAEEPKEAGVEGKAAGNGTSDGTEKNGAGTSGGSAKAAAPVKAVKKRTPSPAKDEKAKGACGKADRASSAVTEEETAAGRQAYEAYGIGQQLPVHLL